MDELVAVCGKWQGNKGFPERLHKVDANNQSKQTTKIVLAAADYVAVAKRAILSAAALFCISAGGNVAIRTGLPASCPVPHFPISFFSNFICVGSSLQRHVAKYSTAFYAAAR